MIKVVLADDHAVVRHGLRFMLEQRPDIQVVGECGDGARALELVTEFLHQLCTSTAAPVYCSTASRSCSVHLWSHLWWNAQRRDFSRVHAGQLTADHIRTVDTSYNRLARPFIPDLDLWRG